MRRFIYERSATNIRDRSLSVFVGSGVFRLVSVLESFYPFVKKILGAVLPLSCCHSEGERGEGNFDSSELCVNTFCCV